MFCIPKNIADKLKDSALKKEWTIESLYDMSSSERRDLFKKYGNDEVAREINKGFEKAIASAQEESLSKWVKSTLGVFDGKDVKLRLNEKIKKIADLGMLDKDNENAFLEDLVSEKLGLNVTQKETIKISELAKDLDAKFEKMGREVKVDIDNKESINNFIAFFESQSNMDKYLQSINPSSRTKVMLSTIGRGVMLASVKSPLLNIISNTVFGTSELLTKRIATGLRLKGANTGMIKDYMKLAVKIYNKTGYDITRTMGFDDLSRILGEKAVRTQGPGTIRKAGRIIEDVIFKKTLGVPDITAASVHMVDTADLLSTTIAKKEGLTGDALKSRAREIMKDALNLNPTTNEGKLIRGRAVEDAVYATLTNKGNLSDLSLKIRESLDKVPMAPGLGEYLIPFAKTPANAIEAQLDYAGVGAIKALKNIIKYKQTGDTDLLVRSVRQATRAGVGIVGGILLVSALKPDDYIGDYPSNPKERALLSQKNATPNSVKIGDKYVSLAYLGPYASVITGYLKADKFSNMSAEQLLDYGKTLVSNAKSTPGVGEVEDLFNTVTENIKKGQDAEAMKEDLLNGIAKGASSRLIPGLVGDLAKMFDEYERKVDYKQPMSVIQANIPGWRNSLEPKESPTGEKKKTEPDYSQLLFGARVKDANQDTVTKELTRLDKVGGTSSLPALSDPRNTGNSRFSKLKEQKGILIQTYAYQDFTKATKSRWEKTINSREYKKASEEDRTKMLNDIRNEEIDNIFKKSKYKLKGEK